MSKTKKQKKSLQNQLLIPIIDNSTKLIKVLNKKKKKKEIRLSKADFLKKTKTKYESSRNISPTTNYIRTCKPTPQNITNLSSIKIIANAI